MDKIELTSLIFLFAAPLTFGEPADSTFSTNEIEEVVVMGKEQEKAPNATTQTLQIEESERRGITSLPNAIKRMAGADIKDYGGIGGLKTISVRSLGSKHTAVTYDGIALSDCQSGQIDLGRFTLEQLSQIKLTIGEDDNILHTARHYGSASVLELQSTSPDYVDKNYNAQVKLKAGSFGLVSPFVSFDHKIGKMNWVKVSADFLRADGQYPYTLTNGKLKTEEKRKHTATESGHAEINGKFQLSSRTQLSAKSYYYASDRELPGQVILNNAKENKETSQDQNFFTQLQTRTDWERTTLLFNGKFNWAACRYHDEAKQYPNGEVNFNYFQREWYGNSTLRYKANDHFSFANAFDYTFNSYNFNAYNCVYPKRHSLQDAISAKYENQWLASTATLLGSYFKNEVEIGEAAKDQKRLSPAWALAFHPFPFDLSFRASYKDIFRMATFNELYFNQVGAKNLNPERTKQYNVGSTYQYRSDKTIKSFGISVDGYYNEVKDKIVAIPRMFFWSFLNLGHVEIFGMDWMSHCEIKTSPRSALLLSAKYAFQKAVDKTDKASAVYGDQIPYTPLHSGNGSLAFENPYLNLSYNINLVGKRYCLPQNKAENRIDAYIEHGITAYKQFKFKHFDTKLRGDVLNLTDKQYEVVKWYPMPRRSYQASVEFIF